MNGKYKKVAYYPGCALKGSAHTYNRSTKAVGGKLGLDLVEVKNWNCCDTVGVKNIDPKLQTYLSSRARPTACFACPSRRLPEPFSLLDPDGYLGAPARAIGAAQGPMRKVRRSMRGGYG